MQDIYTIMRFKCDYSDSIDETFKMIMPIANKKDEFIHHVVYIKLNRRKNFIKNIIFKLKKNGMVKKINMVGVKQHHMVQFHNEDFPHSELHYFVAVKGLVQYLQANHPYGYQDLNLSILLCRLS